MSRLAFCLRCDQMSKITDYKGNPDYDVVLQDFIDRHLHGYHPDETGPGKPHPGAMLFQVEERQSDIDRHVVSDRTGQQLRDESGDLVELSANEIEAVQVARKELRKIGHEIQDLRDELKFDAIVCHRQHGQPSLPGKPCRDYQSEAKLIGRKNTPKELRQWLCTHCFGGETMVVTRTGVFRFDELAEIGQAELLVLPLGNGRNASWKVVPVRSYGEQQLWDVTMWRGRQRRVVRATEGHRCLINGIGAMNCCRRRQIDPWANFASAPTATDGERYNCVVWHNG